MERILLKIRRRRLKKRLQQKPELKFHNSNPTIRNAVLRRLAASSSARIVSVTLDKENAKKEGKINREDVYVLAASELVRAIARIAESRDRLTLVFDVRPCNRDFGVRFDNEMREQATDEYRRAGRIPPEVRVRRLDSLNSRGLQVADFVAGAIQRKYEIGDGSYHAAIAPIIATERLIRLHRKKQLQTLAGVFSMRLMAHIYRPGLTCGRAIHCSRS